MVESVAKWLVLSALGFIAALWLGTLSWIANRQVKRVDTLEREKVGKEELVRIVGELSTQHAELKGALTLLSREAKTDRHAIFDAINAATKNQAETNLRVAEVLGELRGIHNGGAKT